MTDEIAQCSARGCRLPGTWKLQWNNPKIHPAERRKTWLACDEHKEQLSDFLGRRSFLREVEPMDDAPAPGPAEDPGSAADR